MQFMLSVWEHLQNNFGFVLLSLGVPILVLFLSDVLERKTSSVINQKVFCFITSLCTLLALAVLNIAFTHTTGLAHTLLWVFAILVVVVDVVLGLLVMFLTNLVD